MYLVMTKEKVSAQEKEAIKELLPNAKSPSYHYDGESTASIKEQLLKEKEDSVVVSADSRLLQFVELAFELANVYIYEDKELILLQDTTTRILRPGHNLAKLYDAGEFN